METEWKATGYVELCYKIFLFYCRYRLSFFDDKEYSIARQDPPVCVHRSWGDEQGSAKS